MTCSGDREVKHCRSAVRAAARFRAILDAGFALLGESLFPDAEKVTKNALPLHTGLAALDFPHSIPAPGAGVQGPSLALYASRVDSIRPAERGILCRLVVCSSSNEDFAMLLSLLKTFMQLGPNSPSGGRA